MVASYNVALACPQRPLPVMLFSISLVAVTLLSNISNGFNCVNHFVGSNSLTDILCYYGVTSFIVLKVFNHWSGSNVMAVLQ